MPELKIHLPDELDKRFRKTAMTVHGYGRGSISKAAIDALAKWCTDHEIPLGEAEQAGNKDASIRSTSAKENQPTQHIDQPDPGSSNEAVSDLSRGGNRPTAAT